MGEQRGELHRVRVEMQTMNGLRAVDKIVKGCSKSASTAARVQRGATSVRAACTAAPASSLWGIVLGIRTARSSGQAEKLSNHAVRSIQHLRKETSMLAGQDCLLCGEKAPGAALRGLHRRVARAFPNPAHSARFPAPPRRCGGSCLNHPRTSTRRSPCGGYEFPCATGSCRRSSIAPG